MLEDDSTNNILLDFNDPFYDLEITPISKTNINVQTPCETINNQFNKYASKLKFVHINARSLNKNITELKAVIDNTNFDVVAVSESWLTHNTPRNRFHIDGFKIFRNDRKDKRGGGVCVYVKDELSCKQITFQNCSDVPETLWVEVSIGHVKVAIGVLYKPPKIHYSTFENLHDNLVQIYSKYEHTILAGDFNVNMLNHDSNDSIFLTENVIDQFSLKQLISTPTRITNTSSTLIDLLLVSNESNVKFSGSCDAPGISDHFFVYLAYSLKKPKFKSKVVNRRDFRKFDNIAFSSEVEVAPWENVFCVDNVDDKVVILENIINDILDKFAPYRTFVIKRSTTPWLNETIKSKMAERDRCKISFNNTGDQNLWQNYKILKNQVTAMVRTSQKKLFNETLNTKVKSSKDFYAAAKKLDIIRDKQMKGSFNFSANALNDTFLASNNAVIDEKLIDEQIQELYKNSLPSIHKFTFKPVTEIDVIRAVKSIKTMSGGVDQINAFILKLFIKRISNVLTHIINVSFEQNSFPKRWKCAVIIPIPKKLIPIFTKDFRPISLLPTLSKIIEKLANVQIVNYLCTHNMLDPYQSAYRENHSTTTALLKITDDIMDSIDDSEITLLILLDFSKAFDTVNHRLLIEKLKILGFDNTACNWVRSYLSDRYQKVKLESDESELCLMLNGVHQESILGPLLFTILISDMRKCIWNGSYHMYADDSQLYYNSKVETINETIVLANKDLDKIGKYCKNNALHLNESKCCFMIIGTKSGIKKISDINLDSIILNDNKIQRVSFFKNLGLTFDEVLSWRKHINSCISKAMGIFIQFSRYRKFLDKESKKMLCESMVLSQFNYCDIVYMNVDKSIMHKIQKMQNVCLRFIFNLRKKDKVNFDFLRKKLGWLDMYNRRLVHGCTQMYKILNGLAPFYLSDSITLTNELYDISTRSRQNSIWIDKQITSKVHRNSFRFFISTIYNKIPENIKSYKSVNSFKTKLTKYLLNNPMILHPH